ncbi:MAG: hypothetical protein IJH37_12520 [Clostridia bacterium]|nr:hypothetical protein [Clostridia bacterium]
MKPFYSKRIADQEFLSYANTTARDSVNKKIKNAVLFLIIVAVCIICTRTPIANSLPVAILAILALAELASAVMSIVFFVLAIKERGKNKAEYEDGTIIRADQFESQRTNVDGEVFNEDVCVIGLQLESGRQVKIEGEKAKAYYHYVNKNDKVRYHPYLPYPIELYDKSNVNICVFCGTANGSAADKCQKCGKPMLI